MNRTQNPTSEQQIEQYYNERDYSDPSGDDFDALSRDKVLIRSLTQEDLDPVVRIDQKITGRNHRAFFQRKFREVLFESGVRISLVAEGDANVLG